MSKYVIDMSKYVNIAVFRSLVTYFDMFIDVFWHDFPVITKSLKTSLLTCFLYLGYTREVKKCMGLF